jgi:hypothetical protein
MSTSPFSSDGGAASASTPASTAEPTAGYAPPSLDGRPPRAAYPHAPARRGVTGGVVALVAAGTGAVGLIAGFALGSATPGRPADTAAATGAPLSQDLAVAAAPTPASAVDHGAVAPGTGGPESAGTAGRMLASDEGSRENPLPVGTAVSTEEWEVTLGAPREAGDEIRAENQFNGAPPKGMEYWIVPVTATYSGTETGHAGPDLGVEFVGSDARTYSDMCGVIPDDLWDVDKIYDGGTAVGNVCVVVPAGADGLWTLTPGWSAEAVFFTGE